MRICGPQAASSSRVLTVPGRKPVSIASRLAVASTMPAAPSVWPVKPLVELACVRAGKRRATSAASTSSFFALAVPCRLMWSTCAGVDAGARQRVVEGALGAEPFGVRRRHVVRIARFAVAEQLRRAALAGRVRVRASAKPAASPMLMPSRCASKGRHGRGRNELQGVEAEQDAAAQRVDAADDGRVDQAQAQHPLGGGEHLGARRAGGRDRHARALQVERFVHEVGERMRRVHERVAIARRKATVGVERAIGVFGGADARGRGAEDHRDARRAVALARGQGGVDEAVGDEAEPGEPVVAAVPALRAPSATAPIRARRHGRSRSASGVDAEVVRPQRASPGPHGRKQRLPCRRPAAVVVV